MLLTSEHGAPKPGGPGIQPAGGVASAAGVPLAGVPVGGPLAPATMAAQRPGAGGVADGARSGTNSAADLQQWTLPLSRVAQQRLAQSRGAANEPRLEPSATAVISLQGAVTHCTPPNRGRL